MSRHPRAIVLFTLLTLISMRSWADMIVCDLELTPPEVIAIPPDTIKEAPKSEYSWTQLLRQGRLNVRDTSVHYPRFIEFCLDVYRWAEDTFNTYDPAYVSGTGKHGKIRVVSDNWMDGYYFKIPEGLPIMMATKPYCSIGLSANYSILSLSYSVNVGSVLPNEKMSHRKMDLGFSCARLIVEGTYMENKGNTTIRRIGSLKHENIRHINFQGVDSRNFSLSGLYVFNYRKFSLPAAYNLSSYQLRSAGSLLLGIQAALYDCTFDFKQLPQDIFDELELPFDYYKFNYNSLNVLCGYSYNWVIGKHWLFNVSAIPGIGISVSRTDSTAGSIELASAILRGMMSLTYTTRQFFVTCSAKFNGNFFITDTVHYLSGIGDGQFSLGVRF